MSRDQTISVTSHVSRDFLQNAAYFNTMPRLVWEYVANSLDAAKEGELAVVYVEITSHYVTVQDNGIGMNRNDLKNFFQMHGENILRKKGKKVRGRFGTGKCAAFGLANKLQIDTIKNGYQNVVELTREAIKAAEDGKPFQVIDKVVDKRSNRDNGTIVTISELNIRRPNVDEVITYVERHLSRYRQKAKVIINGHECIFKEPLSTQEIIKHPPKDVIQHIGEVTLTIKVSPTPLKSDDMGIDIFSQGIWHETTLAGLENKEKSNFIFGFIDIPILEDGDWAIPAFDNTRNNTLNPQNPVVAVLLGWISEEIEIVRQDLIKQEKERKETEAAKKLEREAKKIADLLNQDFAEQELELELKRRVSKREGNKSINEILSDAGELWPGEGDTITEWQHAGSQHGSGKRGEEGGEGDVPRPGPSVIPGNEPGAKKNTVKGSQKKRRSVFSIDFYNGTEKEERSIYDSETKTIFINLDHPQVSYAYEMGGNKVDSRQFREMCYEIAAVEYAIVLPHEKVEKDEHYDASDALFDVRETINRITRKFMQVIKH